MEGQISKNGNLLMERAGKLKKQFCMHNLEKNCGDWCPMFGEPQFFDEALAINELNEKPHWQLNICGSVYLEFDELEDLR